MKSLEKEIGYTFQNPQLLKKALTHPSALPHGECPDFERLEFLGDRVLGLVIATWVFDSFPQDPEGEMAKRFVGLVRKEALIRVANQLSLVRTMKMKTEKSAAQDKRLETMLADATEALIGALYLDGGLGTAQAFIHRYWNDVLTTTTEPSLDPKSSLQEYVQGQGKGHPQYVVVDSQGPAHAPSFIIEVRIQGFDPVQGEGTSKKLAEKAAAEKMLEKIHSHD